MLRGKKMLIQGALEKFFSATESTALYHMAWDNRYNFVQHIIFSIIISFPPRQTKFCPMPNQGSQRAYRL